MTETATATTAITSRDPWSGELLYETPAATSADVDAAIARAHAAFEAWRAAPVEERAALLTRYAELVERDAELLTELVVKEVGKRVAEARDEVAWTAQTARFYARHPPVEETTEQATVRRAPLGVIAAITPWNVPVITPAWKWMPALMAGNTVVLKPSERATASAVHMDRLLREAGTPEGLVELVPGGRDVAAAICRDARVRGVHFTGSSVGGASLAQLTAPRFIPCALELGGQNVVVVLGDADLDLAARCIVESATAINGQKCTATRRVVVERGVRDELLARIVELTHALVPGDPADERTTLGPLIAPVAREGAERAVAHAVAGGARVLARAEGDAVGSEDTHAVFPLTVLGELAPDDWLRANELFAPVVTVESFATREQAWQRANDSRFGLSAAVFGSDPAALAEATDRLEAGILAVNRRGDAVALDAPFGGAKASGNGWPEGGTYAYAALTHLQAVYGVGA